jgi:hypothetical protein
MLYNIRSRPNRGRQQGKDLLKLRSSFLRFQRIVARGAPITEAALILYSDL